jgi:RNA polymerase sigma-70 factor, ECF subfamily
MKYDSAAEPTDLELALRAKGGDKKAFDILFIRYHQHVRNYIKQMAQHCDADEIVQITFIGVWKNIQKYDPGKGKILTWITSIATNRFIDEHRRIERRSKAYDRFRRSLNHSPKHNGTPMLEAEVFDTRAMWNDLLPLIPKAIKRIPPLQAEALQLMLKGLSQSEIAKKLNEPLGTTKTRIRRGMNALKNALRSLGHLDHLCT